MTPSFSTAVRGALVGESGQLHRVAGGLLTIFDGQDESLVVQPQILQENVVVLPRLRVDAPPLQADPTRIGLCATGLMSAFAALPPIGGKQMRRRNAPMGRQGVRTTIGILRRAGKAILLRHPSVTATHVIPVNSGDSGPNSLIALRKRQRPTNGGSGLPLRHRQANHPPHPFAQTASAAAHRPERRPNPAAKPARCCCTRQPEDQAAAAVGRGQLWGATKADGNYDGGNSVQGFRPSNFTSADTANPPIKEDATSRP